MTPFVLPLYWPHCRLLQKFIGVSQAEAAAVASSSHPDRPATTGGSTPSQDVKSPKQKPKHNKLKP
jgi:hypothetical protein